MRPNGRNFPMDARCSPTRLLNRRAARALNACDVNETFPTMIAVWASKIEQMGIFFLAKNGPGP